MRGMSEALHYCRHCCPQAARALQQVTVHCCLAWVAPIQSITRCSIALQAPRKWQCSPSGQGFTHQCWNPALQQRLKGCPQGKPAIPTARHAALRCSARSLIFITQDESQVYSSSSPWMLRWWAHHLQLPPQIPEPQGHHLEWHQQPMLLKGLRHDWQQAAQSRALSRP